MNTIKFENFKISMFSNLLKESLKTNSSLMLQISDGMMKSASFSKTKSLIKLWQTPVSKFIEVNSELSDDLTTEIDNQFDDLNFNFYILKGETFMKFLDVFSSSTVTLEFSVENQQAKALKIIGKTEANYFIETTFPLTNEEMITNRVEDYAEIINQCTPSPDMFEFFFPKTYILEIKKLVKNLHQVSIENSAYLTLEITETNIKVKDKVFDIDLPNIQQKGIVPSDVIEFNILKSDFILPGEHNFTFSTSKDSPKVIMNGTYSNAIICCVCTKTGTNQISISDDDDDDGLDSFDIQNYDLGDY